MKKLFPLLVLLILVIGCNRNAFVKKIVGNWNLSKYQSNGFDQTAHFDSVKNSYVLTINSNSTFAETWKNIVYTKYTRFDTINHTDTVTHTVTTTIDTIVRDTTVITPQVNKGNWILLNSEEDLQLRDSLYTQREFRIRDISSGNLHLFKSTEDYYYIKK